MKRLLIVYHTMTGAAQQLASAAHSAASEEAGCSAELLTAARCRRSRTFLPPTAICSSRRKTWRRWPVRMKDFFDRIYYGALDKVNGRPYAAIIAAGTDGEGAARQIQRIATGLRLKEIAPPHDRAQRRANA